VEIINNYTYCGGPFHVSNPRLVGEGILDNSLFDPPFRNDGEKTGRKICDTLSMEPTVCPKKGFCSISYFRINSHFEEGSDLLWDMDWKISPWAMRLCFL